MPTSNVKITIVVILIISAYFLFGKWYHGTVKIINDDSTYGQLIGKKFETKIDLFISQFKDTGRIIVEVPGILCPELEEIKKYPCERASSIIHKIVPKGSVFAITNIVMTNKPFRGSDIWIKAKFEDKKIFGDEIDVTFISDSRKHYTEMDSEHVREITAKGETKNEK